MDKTFKYSLFAYEDEGLSYSLRLVESILRRLEKSAISGTALIQRAHSKEEVGKLIHSYKTQSCGSAYSIALINLNGFPSAEFLRFLYSEDTLGNPWTIFLATLRNINRSTYALARDKVETEASSYQGTSMGVPSCIDAYTIDSRTDAAERVSEILVARLKELDRDGTDSFAMSPTEEAMRRSNTTFFGNTSRSGRNKRKSGRLSPPDSRQSSPNENITRTYPGPQSSNS